MSLQVTAPLVDTDGETPAELPPGSVLGRYVVLDAVGSGGAGTVYAVYDSVLDRKVALKLLRARVGDRWAAVVREARMLAKVNHPAVVTVYDVGDFDGCPFVAMEFVAGGDLSLPAPERTPAQALALWLEAARGLAAAHAAGIVHGDFKPANVLVDDAGRPRVSDFGIARATGHGEPTLDPDASEPIDGTTRPGRCIAGTPLYMAPEQLRGGPPTERSDVYALCLTAVEVLAGERKWKTPHDRATAVQAALGRLRATARMPAWLGPILERGLAEEPEQRWPRIADLVDAVDRRRRRSRPAWWYAAVLLGTVGLVGGAAYVALDDASAICEAGAQGIDEVWSEARADDLRRAWLAVDTPGAGRAWQELEQDVEQYVQRWRADYRRACATADEDALSRASLSCLRRRATSLDAAMQSLGSPGPDDVFDADAVVGALPPLQTCSDPERLAVDAPPLPEDARALVDRSAGHAAAGAYDDALAAAQEALEHAQQHPEHTMLRAEAQFAVGTALHFLGRYADARAALEEAYYLALEDDAELTVYAAGQLGATLSTQLEHDVGLVWLRHAEIGRRRRGLPVGSVLSQKAVVLADRGELDASVAAQQRAIEQLEDESAEPRALASARHRLGMALREQGKLDEALQQWEAALAIYRRELGEQHPQVWQTQNGIALVYLEKGEVARAEAMLEEVVERLTAILGPEHPEMTGSLINLAIAHSEGGAGEEALTSFRHAQRILSAELGADHVRVAGVRMNAAVTLDRLDRTDEAIAEFERVLEAYEALPELDPDRFFAWYGYGAALANAERFDDAIDAFERAHAIAQQALPEHLDLPETEFELGRLMLNAGRPSADAIAWLERALERLRGRTDGEALRKRAEAELARARAASG